MSTIGKTSVGQGPKFGQSPSPQSQRDARVQRINQSVDEMRVKTQVIRQQADQIVEGERARQDQQRAELFRLFDLVG